MRADLRCLGALVFAILCSRSLQAQTAVPIWQQTFRPPPTGTESGNSFAARELSDGTFLVVTDGFEAVHYSADGTLLASVRIPIGRSAAASRPRGPRPTTAIPSGDGGYPPGYGRTFASIDAFGRVTIALLADADFQSAFSGEVELARFDGLTGQPLWQSPVFFSAPGIQYPTGLFADAAGNFIVTALSKHGGATFQHLTLKYSGQTGDLLWGPIPLDGAVDVGTAALDPGGNLLLSVPVAVGSTDFEFATVKYASANGSLTWGPIEFSGGARGAEPTASVVDDDENFYVGGYADDQFAILKYDPAGNLLWGPVSYPGSVGMFGSKPTSLALDARGGLFVAGVLVVGNKEFRLTTFKLSAATGGVLWTPALIPSGVSAPAPSLVTFGNGDVAVRGFTGSSSDPDLQLVRYRGSDGATVWGPVDLGTIQTVLPFNYAPFLVASSGAVFGAAMLSGPGSSAFALDGATGAFQWGPTPFTVPAKVSIFFEDLTVGADGNVVATGDNYPGPADSTLKYSGATGSVLWGPVSLSTGDSGFSTFQVLTDSASNVLQIGYSSQSAYIVKYSGSDGSLLWGPTPLPGLGFGLTQMKLDASGNAYVIGYVCGDDQCSYDHAGVTKLSGATGAVLWGPSIFASDPQQSDFPRSLAIAASGDVLVAGDSSVPAVGLSWFAVVFAGNTGALRWGPVGEPGPSDALSAASAGDDFVVTGSTGSGMTTVKYSGANGSKLWGPFYVSAVFGGSGTALAVDASGDVFAAGGVENPETSFDWVTIKYRGSDGTTLWGPKLFDGEAHDEDSVYALGVGVDATGNVVVGGSSQTTDRGSDIAVLKYAGSDGSTIWGPVYAGTGDQEFLNGFGVHGNLVAAGTTANNGFFIQAWNEILAIAQLPSDIPPAFCGEPYTLELTAANGVTPYSWSVLAGSLPSGLSLSATGVLAGTPTEQGTFAFTIRVTDSASHSFDRAYVLLVTEGTEFFGMDAVQFTPCQFTLSLTGTWTSYLWSPGGQTSPTIVVSPTETTPFGVAATDAEGCVHRFSRTIPGIVLQSPDCSGPIVASVSPPSGPAAGGTALTISGSNFAGGATVVIGGSAAGDVAVVDPTQITATAPSLEPGTAYVVTVVNPDSASAALPDAWFADFLDVPPSNIFHDDIAILAASGITSGCGGGNYCSATAVTRAQMAVFLLRSEHGAFYQPQACFSPVFADVPCTDPFAPWINALAAEGVTAGCGGGNYCPSSPVTRGQMPVFLLKTRNGSVYNPPPATGIFGDVPATDPFAPWIEEVYHEGITGGCSSSPLLYCPGSPTTRGQMAVFLVKTFGLQ
jgi:hypothetical protein